MMTKCVTNNSNEETISVFDRGLAYGDGVFTTAKISSGMIEMHDEHLSRLIHSCQVLSIDGVNFEQLSAQISLLAKPHQLAVIKIIITSGQGGRGYSRVGVKQPNVIITVNPFPEHYHSWQTEGIVLGDSQLSLGINPMLSGLKHLNRLEQVLLRKELDEKESFNDLVVYNVNQHIVETTSSNLFWFKAGQWYTAKITDSGVNGLKRQAILLKYPEILAVETGKEALDNVESMFICNSVMGIVPVRRYNDRPIKMSPVFNLMQNLTQ